MKTFDLHHPSRAELYALEQAARRERALAPSASRWCAMRKPSASFWEKAARSLPPALRARYAAYFEQAERWELALDGLIELGSRVRARFGRTLHST